MDSYRSFASFYDELMEDARYSDRCEHFLELLKRHCHECGSTLDLACGTGSFTLELRRHGVDVFGVDGSVEMLSEAMQKCLAEGEHVLFVNQQMQELELAAPVDTCVCTLDSLNHITDVEELRRTFEGVARYLNSGGLFVFDVNTVYKHRQVLGNNAFVLENEHVFCAWQNTLAEDDVVEIDLDFFEEQEDGAYARYSESFAERAYSDAQLRELLESAGFTVEAVYGDLSFDAPKPDEQRVIYVARKEETNG